MAIKIGNLSLSSAFVGDKAIQKIYVGNDLKWSAEEDPFYAWASGEITSLTADELRGATQIPQNFFYRKDKLTYLEIPITVTRIANMFSAPLMSGDDTPSCPLLTEIHYEGTMEQMRAITINGWLSGNDSITSVVCSDGTFTNNIRENDTSTWS